MAFLLYARSAAGLTPAGEGFSLAGYNLIHAAWVQHDEEFDPDIDDAQREKILGNLPDPTANPDFVEFLYLTGPWGWGKNGMTNAAFLHGPAREYFRQFF